MQPPFDGQVVIDLEIGAESKHYCTQFGGTTKKNQQKPSGVRITVRKDAPAAGCATQITTTTTTAATTTSTIGHTTTTLSTYRTHGLNFSPYLDGQDPGQGTQISQAQLRARMRIIAPYTEWIRTFGSTNGLERAGVIAHDLGLQAAVGAWLDADLATNEQELANLIAAAHNGEVDMAIVGSEVLLRGDITEGQLIAYINRVKQEVQGIQVTTADVYGELLAHPAVVSAVDLVFVNYYPYWNGIAVENGIAAVHSWHQQLTAAAGGKTVMVSETGWPSCGEQQGNALPSPQNAVFYFVNFVSWARANEIPYFYFAAFDEAWKVREEGPQGACWGVWDKDGKLKRCMQDVFDAWTIPDNWSGREIPGGPGEPMIEFTQVPPYGNVDDLLQGQVWHVLPADYAVAVYIKGGRRLVDEAVLRPTADDDTGGRIMDLRHYDRGRRSRGHGDRRLPGSRRL